MSVVEPSSDGPSGGRRIPSTVTRAGAGIIGRSSGLPVPSDLDQDPQVFRRRKRRTRLWMVLLLLTPVCLAVISLLTFATDGPPEPTVAARSVPTGYTAITDADFGYAVPIGYHQNPTWTDQNADFLYGKPTGFVAETLEIRKEAPTSATVPPLSLRSFGEPDPVAYAVSGGHHAHIPGTSFAWEESISRPGGYEAVAVDAWERGTTTEIWLLVHAPAAVTSRVLASLQG